ncbi:GCN5-related N-acetyltransferase [Anaeromyxobacter dehalogenans 2CP-1]|uniref:GCN5-related N-acetyltransferase n=1 Tax=Anaeromyxobacter dehalogenans (strain ATCC BAA-258 / DSM 21875 / 2CP-1) TaxID=455488 RepID=B8J9B4_ANAD2|nr:GNAT family N-acetyltransferase [Anaeromyxobacter dehalogenans]ACL65520.1 GCN5-related N-acetyltransferase [Anaeromyxobacter dehalogenans 2CP-1]
MLPSTRATTGGTELRRGGYEISTRRDRLDLDLVHRFLSTEFWDTLGMTREVLERAVERSLCFGVYEGDRQVGFARVVTDGATFAFITDDFILPAHRGQGLGAWMMRCILAQPSLQGLRRVLLVTHDPRLYLKSGFTPLSEPETYMELAATGG